MTEINSTGANTIVTIIAIILTILSWIINFLQWRKNKKLSGRVTAMELVTYIDRFHYCNIKIKETVLKKNWYKGTSGTEVAHELSKVLSDYNRYCHLFTDAEINILDPMYSEANKLLLSFMGENTEFKVQMLKYLNMIDKELQSKKIDEQGYLGKI